MWLTLAEVADELTVSVRTVMRWVQRGELPAIELPGGRKRVHRHTFNLWLASLRTTSLHALEREQPCRPGGLNATDVAGGADGVNTEPSTTPRQPASGGL